MRARSFVSQLRAVLAMFLREWPHGIASLVVPIVATYALAIVAP